MQKCSSAGVREEAGAEFQRCPGELHLQRNETVRERMADLCRQRGPRQRTRNGECSRSRQAESRENEAVENVRPPPRTQRRVRRVSREKNEKENGRGSGSGVAPRKERQKPRI